MWFTVGVWKGNGVDQPSHSQSDILLLAVRKRVRYVSQSVLNSLKRCL